VFHRAKEALFSALLFLDVNFSDFKFENGPINRSEMSFASRSKFSIERQFELPLDHS